MMGIVTRQVVMTHQGQDQKILHHQALHQEDGQVLSQPKTVNQGENQVLVSHQGLNQEWYRMKSK